MKKPIRALEVRRAATAQPLGEPFAVRSLMPSIGRATVKRELARLEKEGAIRRVARGIFVRPETNSYVGEVPPAVSKVAQAIARKAGQVIQVSGAEAANRVGLSTQQPMREVFLTTGSSRKVRIGQRQIELRHASPRKLALAGQPAGVALTALWYLGKEEVSPSTFETIEARIGSEEFSALSGARSSMPAWMIKALEEYQASQSG